MVNVNLLIYTMKKILFSMALVISAMTGIHAQTLVADITSPLFSSLSFSMIPNCFTSDNSTMFFSYVNGEIQIYDENVNKVKTLSDPSMQYIYSHGYYERAKLLPVSFNVGKYSDTEVTLCRNIDDFLLMRNGQSNYKLVKFTDAEGKPSCYNEYENPNFHIDINGNKYPDVYYCFDEYVFEGSSVPAVGVRRIHATYTPVYNQDLAVFVADKEKDDVDFQYNKVLETSYKDGSYPWYSSVYLSQTLFNDDDKWECARFNYGDTIMNYGEIQRSSGHGDTLYLSRYVSVKRETLGFGIYNEDNEPLLTIPIAQEYDGLQYSNTNGSRPSIYRVGDKIYIGFIASYGAQYGSGIVYKNYIYLYDKKTTAVRKVSETKSVPFITRNANGLNVNIGDEDRNGDVLLVNAAGQTVATHHISGNASSVKINSGEIPAGMYSVSITKDGKINRNQKVVMK